MSHRSDLIDIAVTLKHETEKAYLVDDGTQQVWVPKALCEIDHNSDGRSSILTLPESIALEKGLI